MVCLRSSHFNTCRRDVIEIILQVGWQLNFIEGEILVIVGGCQKGEVWFLESTGYEIGFLTLLGKSFNAVIDRMPVHNVFIL